MNPLFFRIVLLSHLLLLTCATVHATGGIVVENAWIREAPPNTKTLAAYMTIQNHGNKMRSLSTVTSTQFEKVEPHLSSNINGIAKMKAIKNVDIPAEGSVLFTPGGLHLMLIGAKVPLRKGNIVNLIFHFSEGSPLAVDVMVKKAKSSAPRKHDAATHDTTQHNTHTTH